jgi:hypothetical protein
MLFIVKIIVKGLILECFSTTLSTYVLKAKHLVFGGLTSKPVLSLPRGHPCLTAGKLSTFH